MLEQEDIGRTSFEVIQSAIIANINNTVLQAYTGAVAAVFFDVFFTYSNNVQQNIFLNIAK
jgi:hypothetical protein